MPADIQNRLTDKDKVLIGLDVGGSITKIIGFRAGKLLEETRVQANDPVASAYGALGKFLTLNDLQLDQVDSIHATGVGASYLDGRLLECKTVIVPEFEAVGIGGLYTASVDRAIVVSMGTGTSLIYAHDRQIRHIIGSGVGGGTLLGLAQVMLNVRDFKNIEEMASLGRLEEVDLSIGDISRDEIPGLSSSTTASNFGKVGDHVTPSDLALGIVNLVFQSVGTSAVLAARLEKVDKIVMTGNLMRVDKGREVLQGFSQLYKIDIIVPERAEYATAIGAALYIPQD
ncbi:MAG: type II pantothenate kinase [Clostridiaceae bacterium]|nr:type II pantothenate kinase [Clostridiaceae bacterium]